MKQENGRPLNHDNEQRSGKGTSIHTAMTRSKEPNTTQTTRSGRSINDAHEPATEDKPGDNNRRSTPDNNGQRHRATDQQ